MTRELFTLESALARSNARMPEAIARFGSAARIDLTGLPAGALAYLLGQVAHTRDGQMVLVTSDSDLAQRLASNLSFFCNAQLSAEDPGDVLLLRALDTTPFLDVAPERRTVMDRLAVLFHLAAGLPWKFLVAPAPALVRRVPPRSAILTRSAHVRTESEVDRDALIALLTEGGYLRAPVAEDPGTFAVRGSLLDVFPPHARNPARIEFDDWLVVSIRWFDPETQRTERDAQELRIHPVREAVFNAQEKELARRRLIELADAIDLPSARRDHFLAELDSDRLSLSTSGLLPAFYGALESLFDYVPDDASVVVYDPAGVERAIADHLAEAESDRAGRMAARVPAFGIGDHYVTTERLQSLLGSHPLRVVHPVAVTGAGSSEDSRPLAFLETPSAEPLNLGAEDQALVAAELSRERAREGSSGSLTPLAEWIHAWKGSHLRVVLAARSTAQADRVASLLSSYGISSKGGSEAIEVRVGDLADGFVFATEGVVFVTEEEIFGARTHRRSRTRAPSAKSRAFVEDLRALEPGDFVVHTDHGVGRYLGIERKTLGQSLAERMRGEARTPVEVLLIEYAAGDRLFLPVTRLNQIDKYATKEGQPPKLDRLGGQTFAATKNRVRQSVRDLADQLLALYAQREAVERPPLPEVDRSYAEFEAKFPFEETRDQAQAIDEVIEDLSDARPMDRVVCGDVGFGKTEVALRASFRVAMNGRQVAMLCPTTVLAQQHFLTFKDRFADYPVRIEVLSRFVDRRAQTDTLAALKQGQVDVLVGTHRLLSKDVHFKNLGLLVVDEEQRFGVTHKERIKQLRAEVDVLTLTATPIPRTLQMAVGGLRDLSVISTPPVDRRAIRTLVCRWDPAIVRDAIERELGRGGQVFFVFNRIDGLHERAQRVQELAPHARVAVGHGQMKEELLERVMTDFVEGRYDVLVSTAIVESGLDIPRANTILIDRADAFGLAQLYQLRGRVGRAKERAYCYLITPPPSAMTEEARQRIEALERFTELGSGLHLASLDMELRGAGDLLGAEQSGNVAAVGFELFVQLLHEAIAQLRGETVVHEVDTELAIEGEQYIPVEYIEDVGLRLSFYKRLASADDEEAVAETASEMEDRFGPLPQPTRELVRAMALRPGLRKLRVLSCEATAERVTLHLRADTPLDPTKVLALVSNEPSWRLSPDMKLTSRFPPEPGHDAIDRVRETIQQVGGR